MCFNGNTSDSGYVHTERIDTMSEKFTLDEIYRKAETVPVVTEKADTEQSETERDAVNHPEHYTHGGIECIDALKAATTGLQGIEAVCTANAIKYLWRWKYKNGVQDIEKAIWYLERLKQEVQGND